MIALITALVLSIVGHPVPVSCDLTPQLAGYAFMDDTPVHIGLSPATCFYANDALSHARREAPLNDGYAVLAVIHESEHIALWSRDEGVVECTALRLLPSVLARIDGRGFWDARVGLSVRLWEGALVDQATRGHETLPARYRTVC